MISVKVNVCVKMYFLFIYFLQIFSIQIGLSPDKTAVSPDLSSTSILWLQIWRHQSTHCWHKHLALATPPARARHLWESCGSQSPSTLTASTWLWKLQLAVLNVLFCSLCKPFFLFAGNIYLILKQKDYTYTYIVYIL